MNSKTAKFVGRIVGLFVVTLFAVLVMLATGTKFWRSNGDSGGTEREIQNEQTTSAPVFIKELQRETIEIVDTYTGMIRPFERYDLGFEFGGRIQSLGSNEDGGQLDETDAVAAGQVLAVLDQRILQARQQEATARLEQAESDFSRAKNVKERGRSTITEAEFQQRVTDLAVAKAQAATAQKQLEDATLVSPCDGVISKRNSNVGESVNPQQMVFEIVEVDRVLLVVGVPESRIQEIHSRQAFVEENCTRAGVGNAEADLRPIGDRELEFIAHVEFLGANRFGQRWPPMVGTVYRISETADDKTGLFEVAILLPNEQRRFRPGLIATARLVIDHVDGFRVPVTSVIFRNGQPNIFTVTQIDTNLEYLFWDLGGAAELRAQLFQPNRWIEQEDDVVLLDLPDRHRTLVTRGQHRLVDGRRVRVASSESRPLSDLSRLPQVPRDES